MTQSATKCYVVAFLLHQSRRNVLDAAFLSTDDPATALRLLYSDYEQQGTTVISSFIREVPQYLIGLLKKSSTLAVAGEPSHISQAREEAPHG